MKLRVEKINPSVLRQCREQISMSLAEAEKKVGKLEDIENGEKKPTYKQIDDLAKLYGVPRWVFISESLPEQYQFDKAIPAFRQFAQRRSRLFNETKIRTLIARLERYRDLILELRNDMEEPVAPFKPPVLQLDDPEIAAEQTRKWLAVQPQDIFDLYNGRKSWRIKTFLFL